MSTLVPDLVYNTAQLLVDGAAVLAVRSMVRDKPGSGKWRVPVLTAALTAVVFSPLSMFWERDLFLVMRMLAWGVFVHGPLVFAGTALWVQGLWRWGLIGAATVVCAIGADAFVYEPGALQLSTHTIEVAGLTEPVRVAVIADLQTDGVTRHERRAITMAMDAKPDLIVFPGDLVQHHDPVRYADVQQDLNALFHELGLAAPLGIVAVEGNVDWGPGAWPAVFDGLSVHASSRSQRLDLGPLVVTALSFNDSFDTTLHVEPTTKPHLVLGHGPDFALGSIAGDVLIAGHTHGGQVVLPGFGPPVTLTRVPRPWASGLTRLESTTLFVSRGVGMERHNAPRLRFLCRPEVVILELVPPR